ncbi:pyruvate formate lyase-activating protein [Kibdelosporangium philippinense]|uniref:Pyruvate formate-lyase-activating enzyme n=1 Tax=Kibdelosporangium philippinense TaxID=211113 RepID=A0ABS8Z9V0_9PSEU|nr:pyruvate formate-lyase-activating protein [Kibdelosporangium philippinense]MCE7004641.1 pyruvate formate lyase-activating protein [Kibdelosporangium philippinense]
MNTVGSVHSWDIATAVDGPGTRFVLFMNGCPLRCLYCENPETWRMRDGHRMTVSEVMLEVLKYKRFIDVAGGGFTVSGGEPLLQPGFVGSLLHEVKALGLHTAIDTSGFLGARASDAMLDDTDLVLLDIKSWDPVLYRRVTGVELAPTLQFARRLSERGNPMWIRFVLVPGLTDDPANVEGIASFVSTLKIVERVEILPFHKLGAPKYAKLGLKFPLAHAPTPNIELVEQVRDSFRTHGCTVY